MRIFRSLMPVVFGTALLSACGGDKPAEQPAPTAEPTKTETSEAPKTTASDLLERLNSGGTIIVGTEGTYAPFSYHDETGKLTGYDVEVTRAIADKLGVKVEFKETQWDAMLAGLDAGRFDMVANQVNLQSEERKAKYDGTTNYTYSTAVVLAKPETQVASWEDLKGKKSAQSLTVNFGKIAEKYGATLEPIEGLSQAITLVQQDRADVTINDKLAVLEYFKAKPDHGLAIKLEGGKEYEQSSGIALRKGEEAAVAKLNDAIKQLQDDGTLARLGEQFFGQDVSKPQQ